MTIAAPARTAAAATAGLCVSTETSAPSAASPSITGTTRAISSSAAHRRAVAARGLAADVEDVRPGRSSARPRASRASSVSSSPASENESGVALTMPISSGRSSGSTRPAAAQDRRAAAHGIRSALLLTVLLPAWSAAVTRSV